MTKHDLKELAAIGAELGAAKAENERLRGLLRECAGQIKADIHAALSRQAEPTDTYTAVDMATAAAQGFRDGQAAVEPAPAQDELDPIEKAALDARLRRDFEARWPVPKGVIWGAAVGDYCLSEFAQGIALSYPDMWMAYKAGSERGKA